MKTYKIIFIAILILFSALIAQEAGAEIVNEKQEAGAETVNEKQEDGAEIVNEKYQFIKNIYSDSWALIIGINQYQNVDPLTYAVADAIAVNAMLIEKYGFKESNIRLIMDEDATKDNILAGFSDILTQAKEKDRVIVFYAGHGETYKLPSDGDMGYLIPVDGNLDNLYLSSIPMKSVYDIAEMSYAKHILYLVDACYGGLTLNTRGLKKDTTPEYIKKMTRERGRQVITAGGKDEQVQERPEWGHSAFTRNLLKGLGEGFADENNDGMITADELGGFIKNRVVVDVDGAHTPQKGRIGSDMGEFVFISETLDGQFADNSPGSEQLTDLESEMAEIKKLLKLQTQQRGSQDTDLRGNYPKATRENMKSKKSNRMKTASTLAWVFPGAGHFYSGRTGKGLFYTGLELAALAGVAVTSGNYTTKVDEYNAAQTELLLFEEDVINGEEWTQSDANIKMQAVTDAYDAQNQALYGLIGTGTVSGIVWLWNIFDVKKSGSNSYSDNNQFSVGMNRYGQVEARISF